MPEVSANPFLGIAFHAVGALFAATCYIPQKRVLGWSWQTYWLTQALFCWFIMPIIGALFTIPDLVEVLREAPRDAMWNSFLLGAAYGIGGTAFGLAIRYIGYSLTYAIAIGISSVLGTIIPALLSGTLVSNFMKPGGSWVLVGLLTGVAGIALCGIAGRAKEVGMSSEAKATGEFSLAKGLLLSLLAGILSAVYGLALNAGQPIADVAALHGAGVWQGNVIYLFANSGAFITTACYCIYLMSKNSTIGEFTRLTGQSGRSTLKVNFIMAVLTGVMWYGQFFFYNLGHVRMGDFKFTSWAIHMIMLVLLSGAVGIVLREWKSAQLNAKTMIAIALAVLAAAVIFITTGNYIGASSKPSTSETSH